MIPLRSRTYVFSCRIWLLHSLLFFTAICIVAGAGSPEIIISCASNMSSQMSQEPKDEEEETVAGRTVPVRFAALGLVAPCHAILVTVPLGLKTTELRAL